MPNHALRRDRTSAHQLSLVLPRGLTRPSRHRRRGTTARARADLTVGFIIVFAFAMHVAAQTLVGGAS